MTSNTNEGNPGSLLQPGETIRPKVNPNLAIKLVKEYFGYDVIKIKELNSYDDVNYLVDVNAEDGSTQKFVFKILNSMDSKKPQYIEAQAQIMQLLSSKGINCSMPQKTLDGKNSALVPFPPSPDDQNNAQGDGQTKIHLIRLLSFIPGTIFVDAKLTTNLLFKAGKYISEFEQHLKNFRHVGLDGHTSVWFLNSALDLKKFLYVLDDRTDKQNLVLSVLEAFEKRVLPAYPNLEAGVLHGDFNEQNIICSPSTTNSNEFDIYGIIDFGDTNVGNYVNELAITMCYMMIESVKHNMDPLESTAHVLAGYSSFRKVPDEELNILRTCIAVRLCQSLVMGAYSYTLDPGNTYLLTTANIGWPLLEKLWRNTSDEEIQTVWRNVSKEYSSSSQ